MCSVMEYTLTAMLTSNNLCLRYTILFLAFSIIQECIYNQLAIKNTIKYIVNYSCATKSVVTTNYLCICILQWITHVYGII